MSEIKTALIILAPGDNYTATGEEYVITENNSINDVLRLVVDQMQGDVEEVELMLDDLRG